MNHFISVLHYTQSLCLPWLPEEATQLATYIYLSKREGNLSAVNPILGLG